MDGTAKGLGRNETWTDVERLQVGVDGKLVGREKGWRSVEGMVVLHSGDGGGGGGGKKATR